MAVMAILPLLPPLSGARPPAGGHTDLAAADRKGACLDDSF
jgi:hypothetical protein